MTEPDGTDLTTQILIQIRDEMRAMRASFDLRMGAIELRMSSLETGFYRLEAKVDSLQTQVDFLSGKIDALEVRVDALDERNETQHQELFRRIDIVHGDLKKFAGIANETILHFAGEMDDVRERLGAVEGRVRMGATTE